MFSSRFEQYEVSVWTRQAAQQTLGELIRGPYTIMAVLLSLGCLAGPGMPTIRVTHNTEGRVSTLPIL